MLRFLFIVGFTLLLGWTVLNLPESAPGLTAAVRMHLEQSGVSHPVTAVLLNFRGYDTLLEIVVLILAVLGVWSLRYADGAAVAACECPQVLASLVRLLAPVIIVVAGYLLWCGAHEPGGAFQGGAILAVGGVLWSLAYRVAPTVRSALLIRVALVLGFAVFLTVATAVMTNGANLLEYPHAWAGELILLIEATLTVSIGVILALLFVGAPSARSNSAIDPLSLSKRTP
ncbi:MAG: sodium:proton antiporter [Pseudomonadota bacterium]|nr:sodium:proton antiporter [Pseudomonadota bacterium]